MNVPHCPAHGDTCMPMLRAGLWWCPTGSHLVMHRPPLRPKLPPDLRRIMKPAA